MVARRWTSHARAGAADQGGSEEGEGYRRRSLGSDQGVASLDGPLCKSGSRSFGLSYHIGFNTLSGLAVPLELAK